MFFFFAGGLEQQVRQVVKTGAGRCINCRSSADLVEYDKVLKLFFVPVWRWPGKNQLMHCDNCGLFFPPSLSISDSIRSADDIRRRCRYCAGEVEPGFNFCPFCGSAL